MVRRRLIAVLSTAVLAATALPGTFPSAAAAAGASGADQAATVVGEVERFTLELRDRTTLDLTVVRTEDGGAVAVDEAALADVASGTVVEADLVDLPDPGAAVTDADAVAQVAAVEVVATTHAAEAAADAAFAEIRTADRPVYMMTSRIGAQASDAVTPSVLRTELVERVAPYWDDSTDGAVRFTEGAAFEADAYTGWGSTADCGLDKVVAFLDWSVAQAGTGPVVWTGRHTVVYTPALAACPFEGIANVADGGAAWINGADGEFRWYTMAHELGHTLTLGHSSSRVHCDGGRADGTELQCDGTEYGDAYDVMGVAYQTEPTLNAGPVSGAHLDTMGLLDTTNTTFAAAGAVVTLAPVGSGAGKRFVHFSTGGATYYVEHRAATGRDTDLATSRAGCPFSPCTVTRFEPGVIVRRVDETGLGADTYLLDAAVEDPASSPTDPYFVVEPGRSFVTADGRIRVTVTSASASGATVNLVNAQAPTTPFRSLVASPDLTGDRVGDLLGVDGDGVLFLYPGRGDGRVASPTKFAGGWDVYEVHAPGDWNGDGRGDLVAVDAAGKLWLYPGNGRGGFLARSQIGQGWTTFRIVPAGDMNADGRTDLLAIDSSHRLWLYPGDGRGGFRPRIQVGNGWNGYDLYAAGDANGDGRADILSVDAAGQLFYYAGRGGGYFSGRVKAGYGWTGYEFASGADFNRDGRADLMGRDSNGRLWFYAGRGPGRFAMKVLVGQGF